MFCLFFRFARLPNQPGAFSLTLELPNMLKYYVNRNALSMLEALNNSFKLKCAVLLLNHVESRLKSLEFQH